MFDNIFSAAALVLFGAVVLAASLPDGPPAAVAEAAQAMPVMTLPAVEVTAQRTPPAQPLDIGE